MEFPLTNQDKMEHMSQRITYINLKEDIIIKKYNSIIVSGQAPLSETIKLIALQICLKYILTLYQSNLHWN